MFGNVFNSFFKIKTADKVGVDEMGVDEMGSRQSRNKPK